ncbi:transposase [Caldithrix abyssi]|nr:transposase [Caldithrix abyssi]
MKNPVVEDNVFGDILETVIEHETDGIRSIMKMSLDYAMKLERTEDRIDHANEFKPKTIHTRMCVIPVEIPQVRGLKFYLQSLERGCRSEKALKLAILGRYALVVSHS